MKESNRLLQGNRALLRGRKALQRSEQPLQPFSPRAMSVLSREMLRVASKADTKPAGNHRGQRGQQISWWGLGGPQVHSWVFSLGHVPTTGLHRKGSFKPKQKASAKQSTDISGYSRTHQGVRPTEYTRY